MVIINNRKLFPLELPLYALHYKVEARPNDTSSTIQVSQQQNSVVQYLKKSKANI